MESFNQKVLFFTLAVIFLVHFSEHYHAEAKIDDFTTHLISRDSPLCPFYNPSETKYQRLRKAFRRSILRSNNFRAMRISPNDILSNVISGGGEYLMNVSIGTPPVPMLGIADTGSDLIWRQCLPCDDCYQQDEPIFDPQKSKTYKTLACDDEFCQYLGQLSSCSTDGNVCTYIYLYGDLSYTSGNLSSDTLTIGSNEGQAASFPGLAFGCGHSNGGNFDKKHGGIIGLGGGPLSLVKQLSSKIGGRFSYCLLPLSSASTASSKIIFGRSGAVSGSGTVSTPLIKGSLATLYHLTMEGMSLGSKRVEFKGFSKNKYSPAAAEGNIIIDSGTTLTFLPQDFYNDVESALKSAIGGETTTDPRRIFDLCYSSLSNLQIPTVTAHFTGADVKLQPLNIFIQVQEDLVCFSMLPTQDLGIFGNLAQMNFLVGYDLKNNKVSFKPTDCSKH